ncbi:MAG TPA: hypothetical protein VFD99_05385 [Arthrobacter sp.]|jgi:hypothetical protein|nr:hypothetical protein [Arthrobacter sp.]
MPALSGSAPLGIWPMLALAAVVVVAVAVAAYLARKHVNAAAGLPDAVFWDGFAGLAVVAPAVILSSLAVPWAGLMLGLLAAVTALTAYRWAPRIVGWQEFRRESRATVSANEAAGARHRSALARWQRYELDPSYCWNYPAMSDPRQPETAALIRAMKAAERLRGGAEADYAPAVARLEQALADAERAAGVGLNAAP